jgi:cyclopropane fatty-acyl-phospholipid synthase-like methyltransferase
MAQVTAGVRRPLSSARFYNVFQSLLGAHHGRTTLAASYVRAKSGDRVLDIGCGTAQILDYLPAVDYCGVDRSRAYIDAARKRFKERATFYCDDVNAINLTGLPKFDIVLSIGVLHHLDDTEVTTLLTLAKSALRAGGRLVTMDPCYTEHQSRIARFAISRDRGQNIRQDTRYGHLATLVFAHVDTHIRHDLSRIPYTHLVMEGTATASDQT